MSIDPSTQTLVSRVYSQETGELLSQVPDQALLRLKIYAREAVAALDAKESAPRVQRLV